MTDIEILWESVEQNTDDKVLWAILADALEEVSQDRLSKTIRWMIKYKKRPVAGSFLSGNVSFYWGNLDYFSEFSWILPSKIFVKLHLYTYKAYYSIKYDSIIRAIEDLSLALEELKLI